MSDLRDPRWMYVKAALFLVVGGLASALLLIDSPRWRTLIFLGLAVWAFCRAYYFAFYVVQHYADPGYRFAGLVGFARYLWRRRRRPGGGRRGSAVKLRKGRRGEIFR